MKYQVNMFYSLTVEAESEEQAEEKAGEYIASEEGQGVRLSDMSIEVEEIDEGMVAAHKALDEFEAGAGVRSCGNCGREATRRIGDMNRCERCAGL